MSRRVIRNADTGDVILGRAKWCASFWCKLRGLQFTFQLDDDAGLLFVNSRESRTESAIHMLFMFMEIAVVWLDSSGRVVDKQRAKPWRLAYVPQKAAQYYIEARPELLERVEIGDVLQFDEETA
jgi:hypothetical protein